MPNFDALNDFAVTKQQVLSAVSNPVRGQLISLILVGKIAKNSLSAKATSYGAISDISQGPAQDVDVYKVLYWSGQTDQNGPQIVSGSLLVPVNITKSEILQTRNGATWQYADYTLPWFNLAKGLDLKLINYETVSMAGLGYVTVHADGFGLGANEGKVVGFSDYFGEINPHVDMLRAVREKLPSVGFKGSVDPLNIIYFGYSNGAAFGVGIVNELVPGNSSKISSTEAAKFSFNRLLLGSGNNAYDELVATASDPTKTFVSLEVFGLACWVIASMESAQMVARPSALHQIINPLVKGDFWGASNDKTIVQTLITLLTWNASTNISNPADPDNNYTNPDPVNGVGDFRQLINLNNFKKYAYELLNNHGWTNINAPLNKFPQIPVTMIYSSADQVVAPATGANAQEVGLKIVTGTGFDGTATLDAYMGTGKTLGAVTVPGAGKPITVYSTLNDKDQASVQAIGTLIKNTTGNKYVRIRLETSNIRGFNFPASYGRGDHDGNSITWFESTYYALQ